VKNYWILRSWSADASLTAKLNSLTFNNLGLKPASTQLFYRWGNGENNSWTNSSIVPTGNVVFSAQNKLTINSQFVILGDTLNTSVLDINGLQIALKAYPNPTQNVVEFTFGKVENALDVEVILSDLLGKNLQQKSLKIDASESKTTLDLSGYASGFYVVSIRYKGQVVCGMRVSKI
jgi:Secretion system C-terminal sorting domain